MSSRYLDMMRGQRRRNPSIQFTSKTLLAILAIIAMVLARRCTGGAYSRR